MAGKTDISGAAVKNGSAVLMARMIDSQGINIRQSDVSAIEYSIHELVPCRRENLTAVEGHNRVALTVGTVIFDSLQTGSLWTVDDMGYNFRHEIKSTQYRAFPKAGAHYQVRYQLTPIIGAPTVVRFQLRII